MHISLGHKKQREEHIKRFEDALTSAFFGTLRYMPSRIVLSLFISLLGTKQDSAKKILAEWVPDDVNITMKFWPNTASFGRIEPDLKIVLKHPPSSSQIDLLIECKWKSGEEENQLFDQWEAPQNDPKKTYHVYLVRDLQSGNKVRDTYIRDKPDMNEWFDRLLVISWFDILKILLTLSTNGLDKHSINAVTQWQKDMTAMFDRIGINGFAGFNRISDSEGIKSTGGDVFWKNTFHGFQQFINNKVIASEGAVFFK